MKLSWEWKLRIINGICQGYFFVFISLALIVGLNTTLPYLYADDVRKLFFLKIIAVLVAFTMLISYFFLRYTAHFSLFKPSKKENDNSLSESFYNNLNCGNNNLIAGANAYSRDRSDVTKNCNDFIDDNCIEAGIGGWTYCKDCCDLVPPRTKHCPLCFACVLKRDHHCFFAGCCVGFHNQRYFIIFCMYGAIGGLYSSLVTHSYLWYHYEGLQNWGIVAYFLPPLLWFWLVGATSGFVVVMTLFLYWNCLTAFICFYYFAMQIFLIYHGQTKYECMKGLHTYRGHFWLNVKSVFGPVWFVSAFLPLPFLGYHGDGKSWDEFAQHKLL